MIEKNWNLRDKIDFFIGVKLKVSHGQGHSLDLPEKKKKNMRNDRCTGGARGQMVEQVCLEDYKLWVP